MAPLNLIKISLNIFLHTDDDNHGLINDLSPFSCDEKGDDCLSVNIDEKISIQDLRRICKYQFAIL